RRLTRARRCLRQKRRREREGGRAMPQRTPPEEGAGQANFVFQGSVKKTVAIWGGVRMAWCLIGWRRGLAHLLVLVRGPGPPHLAGLRPDQPGNERRRGRFPAWGAGGLRRRGIL